MYKEFNALHINILSVHGGRESVIFNAFPLNTITATIIQGALSLCDYLQILQRKAVMLEEKLFRQQLSM